MPGQLKKRKDCFEPSLQITKRAISRAGFLLSKINLRGLVNGLPARKQIETRESELVKYRQSSNSFVYRDRLGKPYATKEQRDQAIRDECLAEGTITQTASNPRRSINPTFRQTWRRHGKRSHRRSHEFAVNKTDKTNDVGKNSVRSSKS